MSRHLSLIVLFALCLGLVIAQQSAGVDSSKPVNINPEKKSEAKEVDDLQTDATFWGGYGGPGWGGLGYYGGWGGGLRGWGGRGFYGGWGGQRYYGGWGRHGYHGGWGRGWGRGYGGYYWR